MKLNNMASSLTSKKCIKWERHGGTRRISDVLALINTETHTGKLRHQLNILVCYFSREAANHFICCDHNKKALTQNSQKIHFMHAMMTMTMIIQKKNLNNNNRQKQMGWTKGQDTSHLWLISSASRVAHVASQNQRTTSIRWGALWCG